MVAGCEGKEGGVTDAPQHPVPRQGCAWVCVHVRISVCLCISMCVCVSPLHQLRCTAVGPIKQLTEQRPGAESNTC